MAFDSGQELDNHGAASGEPARQQLIQHQSHHCASLSDVRAARWKDPTLNCHLTGELLIDATKIFSTEKQSEGRTGAEGAGKGWLARVATASRQQGWAIGLAIPPRLLVLQASCTKAAARLRIDAD
ncbi:hypothetical protein VTN96DRAFT_4577 [Rasamsonia emersonii]